MNPQRPPPPPFPQNPPSPPYPQRTPVPTAPPSPPFPQRAPVPTAHPRSHSALPRPRSSLDRVMLKTAPRRLCPEGPAAPGPTALPGCGPSPRGRGVPLPPGPAPAEPLKGSELRARGSRAPRGPGARIGRLRRAPRANESGTLRRASANQGARRWRPPGLRSRTRRSRELGNRFMLIRWRGAGWGRMDGRRGRGGAGRGAGRKD